MKNHKNPDLSIRAYSVCSFFLTLTAQGKYFQKFPGKVHLKVAILYVVG